MDILPDNDSLSEKELEEILAVLPTLLRDLEAEIQKQQKSQETEI